VLQVIAVLPGLPEVLAEQASELIGRVFLNQMAGFGQDLEPSAPDTPRELATLLYRDPGIGFPPDHQSRSAIWP
jgi:hypothetical protein